MDVFTTYEQFIAHWMQHNEYSNVYLAELWKFAVLFGVVSNCTLTCAFVTVLPDQVKQPLCASSRMDMLSIDQMLARAQVILKYNALQLTAVVTAAS